MGSGTVVVNQPGVYLVDEDGNTVTRADGTAIGTAEGLLIMGKDGTDARYFRVDSNGDLVALPLPTGAATSALQSAANALLTTIDGDTSTLAGVDFATQTTLAAILVDTGQMEALLTTIDADTSALATKDFATETTLASVLTDTGQIEALLTTIDADTSALATVDYATQTTLASILVDTGQIETLLTAIDALLTTIDADTSTLAAVDYATQTTLATLATEAKLELVRALLAAIDADTSVLAGVDFATQTTLAAFKAAFDARDLATQTTLAAVLVDTGQIEALLTTIDVDTSFLATVDYATQTTLLALSNSVGEISATPTADTVQDRLRRIELLGVDRTKLVVANYGKAAVAATTYYMLIDLDGAGYPHVSGTRVIVAGAAGAALKSNSGAKWALQVGVILAINGTDATIGWLPIASISLRDTSQFGAQQIVEIFPNVMDLSQTAGAFDKIATNLSETGVTAVNTGVTLEDALGNNITPAVGDVVLEALLLSGGGTLDFKYGIQYWVE